MDRPWAAGTHEKKTFQTILVELVIILIKINGYIKQSIILNNTAISDMYENILYP